MRIIHIFTVIGIILITILLSGCIQKITGNKNQTQAFEVQYNISSQINYNRTFCKNTGFHHNPEGFNIGSRVVLKDRITGEDLNGYASTSVKSPGDDLNVDKSYSCEEQVNSRNTIISVYSKGYTPLVFEIKLPKNKLTTIEVPMIKSCSGGPSCFDNIKIGLLEKANGNQTKADEISTHFQDGFTETIQKKFGLEKTDYNLSCMECDMGRAGFIKAKGTYKDGSPLELYYHWGWCSSGGSDCGWSTCFSSTSNTLFESIKNRVCDRISSNQYNNDICYLNAYDYTEQVKNKCVAGEYEKTSENKKTLAIKQTETRCTSGVAIGNFNCMDY